jgi:transcriptional regulator with XRE-family HTH domain
LPVTVAADKSALGEFLRSRRQTLQPEDLGLYRGPRRRVGGLRREEVAELTGLSADYIGRLERGSGPWPSNGVLLAIARGLRLTRAELDYLFTLCGRAPDAAPAHEHVDAGMQRVLDRLQDTPAQVMGQAGVTLRQTPPAVALMGDETSYQGLARSAVYRWFTDPAARLLYLPDDHDYTGRAMASLVRDDFVRNGSDSLAAQVVRALLKQSPEFAGLWARAEIGLQFASEKRLEHPEVGRLDVYCQTLSDTESGQALLIYTATPGSKSHERLALLGVIGSDFPRTH